MALLKSQLAYNRTKEFFTTDGESLSQSIHFEKSFSLSSVYVRLGNIRIDPINDIQFRIEVRGNIPPDYLVNLNLDPLASSNWITDNTLFPWANAIYGFSISSAELNPGTYWFTLIPNRRCANNEVSFQRGGNFLGKFLHYKYGTGIYRNDHCLYISVYGTWGTKTGANITIEEESNIITTIRDET
ncbi:MAG: hypothetical protein ACTSQE_16105 [Candidatus Heimdallarchaeaceae archaeon]